jgi:predicted dehydrogenase
MAVWDDLADWPRKLALYRHSIDPKGTNWDFTLSEPDYVALEPNMALTDELAHFIDCIGSGQAPQTDGRQGVAVLRILEQAGR